MTKGALFYIKASALGQRRIDFVRKFRRAIPVRTTRASDIAVDCLFAHSSNCRSKRRCAVPVLPRKARLTRNALNVLSSTGAIGIRSNRSRRIVMDVASGRLSVCGRSIGCLAKCGCLYGRRLTSGLVNLLTCRRCVRDGNRGIGMSGTVQPVVRQLAGRRGGRRL